VERVHAVEDDAGRAGAGERGGDFRADIAGFTDADDDDFAAATEGFVMRLTAVSKDLSS
jgi:hypothetical protein